ncbi:MAG: glutathione synthase [Gammaproteobacteria bacterium]|nr:glutathione synthase [Gammaproteobacteria bacterium]
MTIRLGVIMDPISAIKPWKDSTFAMLLEAQKRGWELCYLEMSNLYLDEGVASGCYRKLEVSDNKESWFVLGDTQGCKLADLDVILMRKDPPFDMQYIYATYLLEQAEAQGCLVVNKPSSLRDANEKLYTAWFPDCCPKTLVSNNKKRIKAFIEKHQDIILKPLDGMGGSSIFRLKINDVNNNVIIENITHNETSFVMAQVYIPEITAGDKRILLIDGKPVPYALARLAAKGETRANLAVGGSSKGIELSKRDHWICEQIGPTLKEKGLTFVGIDVIGDYLTEINVTSPTCIRELDKIFDINISALLMDAIEEKLA